MDALFHNALNLAGDGIVFDEPLPITMMPRTLEYEDEGGPSRAEIDASGALADLLRLRAKLGRSVTIYDESGDPVWWGVCDEVAISDGNAKHTYSLQDVVTSAAIAYEKVGSGAESVGARTVSPWVDDAAGAAKYGRLQTLLSGGRLSDVEAAQRIALALKNGATAYAGSEVADGQIGATIYCSGVWSLLAREYYRDTSNVHSNWPQSNYQQLIGEGSGLNKIATRAVLPGDPTITMSGSLIFQGFEGDQVTVGLSKWLDQTTKLPDTSTVNPGTGVVANYRVMCEIYMDSLTYIADCHHDRNTQYSYPGPPAAQHQDAGAADTQIFITRINGWNPDYGRGGEHNVSPSPKWFVVGDKIRLGFFNGTSTTYGDLAAITSVNATALGVYGVQRGASALAYSNRVYASLPGQFLCRAYIDAKDIAQSMGQVTFKNFVDAYGSTATFPVSSATPIWIVISRTDPPTGAHGEYTGRGYYAVDGSTTMGYTGCDKPFLDGTFTLRGATLVWDAPSGVWRHCIPARDNAGGAQMLFKVSGTRRTTDQMIAMVSKSQWLSGCIIETSSGKNTVPYRNGERAIQDELQALMRLGDYYGNEYVARVDHKRRLVISLKNDGTMLVDRPTGTRITASRGQRVPTIPITRKNNGSLISPSGKPLPLLPPPLGQYVRYEGDAGEMFYVQAATYDPYTDALDLRPANRGQMYDVSSIEDG